ncbi:pentapeptide repeat-containing protein [Kocuria sp. NPDC057446]|uniref:pentapeptide repeat-containing protein n=1 Tax=Kocuria sp. NPDC057446 TaxID=3346137 RepID=UPI00369E372F
MLTWDAVPMLAKDAVTYRDSCLEMINAYLRAGPRPPQSRTDLSEHQKKTSAHSSTGPGGNAEALAAAAVIVRRHTVLEAPYPWPPQQINLSHAYLKDADLSETHLQRVNLSEAMLHHANLCEAHLEGADLTRANLADSSMCDTHLEGASLRCARMERVNLLGASLERADLAGAHLAKTEMNRGGLEGAELQWDPLVRKSRFRKQG